MSMSKEQAIAYIEAGNFPYSTDVNAIVGLQDDFGHFNPLFLAQLAERYPNKAVFLFTKLWGWEQTRQIIDESNRIRDLRNERLALNMERAKIEQRMTAIDAQLAEYDAAYQA